MCAVSEILAVKSLDDYLVIEMQVLLIL